MSFSYEQFCFMRLAEELNELQKEALKCQRFGANHVYNSMTNFDRFKDEFNQVNAVLMELTEKFDLDVTNQEMKNAILVINRVQDKLRREYYSIHVLGEDPSLVGLD